MKIRSALIWRRQRLPTVTVQADTAPGIEAATVVKSLGSNIAAFKQKLPPGYDVAAGGTVEESAKAQGPVQADDAELVQKVAAGQAEEETQHEGEDPLADS